MGRLTQTSDKGGLAFTFDLDVTCEKSEIEKIVRLGQRLKAYEDTGLEPEDMHNAKPLEEWYEEDGDCLWWSFPIEEPPYCGTPLDCDFPDDVTHFTRLVIPQN